MGHAKSTDPNVFILPDLGEGVHEAELIKWRVSVGQAIKEHDILADMETDKAVVEVPSPRAGVITGLHGAEGEILKVGNVLVSYAAGAGDKAKPAAKAAEASGAAGNNQAGNNQAANKQAANQAAAKPAASADREDAGTVVGQMSADVAGMTAAPGKALATPAVRRLARDIGIDIDLVVGTGIGGRVMEKDIKAAGAGSNGMSSSKPAAQAATTGPATGQTLPAPAARFAREDAPVRVETPRIETKAPTAPTTRGMSGMSGADETMRVAFRGVRRTIANRLRESVDRAVHFTVMDEADATGLDSLRKKLAAASGEKVSFLPFVASAIARVLSRAEYRAMNATVDERPGDASYETSVLQHRSVHLGIATDTDAGLMVPVIRDCDRLGVLEISRAVAMVAEMARSRSIPREQLTGSTFTLSNVGSHAGRFATPIINYPEVAILAVGRAREGVVVNKGAMRVGLLLPLSLACDHRVVDGAMAALALAEIVKLLQEPEQLMAPARG